VESPAGSDDPEDCLCMAGYYNNATRCEHCARDAFCEDNAMTLCAAYCWSGNEALRDGPDKCLCHPGLYQSGSACAQCPKDHFCEGTNVAQGCPRNSSTDGLAGQQRCNCIIGFANDLTDNMLSCQLCAAGLFKDSSCNAACAPCQQCAGLMTFEISACVPGSDRVC